MSDVTISGAALTIFTALLAALSGVVGLLFRQLLAAKDAHANDLESDRDSYRRLALEATGLVEHSVNRLRHIRGEEPLPAMPHVIPEHNSPSTAQQLMTAEMATLSARLLAAMQGLGLIVK